MHCKGKDNIVADILSRYPEDRNTEEPLDENHEYYIHKISVRMSPEILAKLRNISNIQMRDEKLKQIVLKIRENRENKLNQYYQIVNNKLYRKCKQQWKLYVPSDISKDLIKEIHVMYGHIGGRKLHETMEEHFTMDSMCQKINKIVKSCNICQTCKDSGNRNITGITQPIIPECKGDMVSVDYYGPLPTSTSGVKYLLVMVDNFTKYVELYAMRRATTTATLRRVQQYIDTHGQPKSILTDNGTQFTSRKWVQGLTQLNIIPRFTAIRNPCTNIAERWNRQLGN